jgi:hypothetical protein
MRLYLSGTHAMVMFSSDANVRYCFRRLGIERGRSDRRQIKQAYRRLAFATYPDMFTNPTEKESWSQLTRSVQEAWPDRDLTWKIVTTGCLLNMDIDELVSFFEGGSFADISRFLREKVAQRRLERLNNMELEYDKWARYIEDHWPDTTLLREWAKTTWMKLDYKDVVDRVRVKISVAATSIMDWKAERLLNRNKNGAEDAKQREIWSCRRRTEQRRRENAAWEKKRQEWEDAHERYRRNQEGRRAAQERAWNEPHDPRCRCEICSIKRFFFDLLFFGVDDDDFDGDDSDGWDRRYDEMDHEEQAKLDKDSAELLGVDVDATQVEIRRQYKRSARKYHPDKHTGAENHEDGMTKQESEDHFKKIGAAYDHLMLQFDD